MIAESADTLRIDAALTAWRQGDVILGSEMQFIHLADLRHAVSDVAAANAPAEPAAAGAAAEFVALESTAEGFVVTTQTCDVVRSCRERPYAELSPLVEVSAAVLAEIKGLKRPGFAFVPSVADKCLVAGLDRTMTIEKGILVALPRTAGMGTDAEVRAFAAALARKRARSAFPNEFVDLMKPLAGRLQKRHGKDSDEGHHVTALQEIRIAASPSWTAARISLFFWFIKGSEPPKPMWTRRLANGWRWSSQRRHLRASKAWRSASMT